MAAAMTRPPRPSMMASSSSSSNPFAAVIAGEENRAGTEPQDDEAALSDEDGSSAEETDDGDETPAPRRAQPPRPSLAAAHHRTAAALSSSSRRNRRRSSARFLQLQPRQRRRSSQGLGAAGHRRGGDDDDDDDEDDDKYNNGGNGSSRNTATRGAVEDNLSALYQKAIRMNAENKINAGNSWNLRLIESIDQFLEDDDGDGDGAGGSSDDEDDDGDGASRTFAKTKNAGAAGPPPPRGSQESSIPVPHRHGKNDSHNHKKRVNFTKASCTLDASVKIYGYRVDDVHLTSYKVLANLNRTDNSNNNNSSGGGHAQPHSDDDNDGDNENADGSRPGKEKRSGKSSSGSGSTLETHLANINLNKLDAAFDIDPLFHKMSKTFDEGGAKGLLLVNLGVGEKGCNVVFDSSSHACDDDVVENDAPADDGTAIESSKMPPRLPEGLMDVTTLTAKLETLLADQNDDDMDGASSTIQGLALVPQLAALRAEHSLLEMGGYVDSAALAATVGPKTPGKRRYQADAAAEREADDTIHKEARERSQRLSLVGGTAARQLRIHDDESPQGGGGNNNDDGFVDFGGGGGYGDDDDDDGDHVFDTYIATAGARFSDISFASGGVAAALTTTTTARTEGAAAATTTTARLIDAIASGATVLSANDYEYFSQASVNHHSNSNHWAGAAHWKRATTSNKSNDAKTKTKKKARPRNAMKKKERVFVSLDVAPDLSHLLGEVGNVRNQKKKRGAPLSTQLSKAMIQKYTNNENLLPADAGFRAEEQLLTRLFLRPNAAATLLVPQQRPQHTAGGGDDDDHNAGAANNNNKTVGFDLPDWEDGGDNDGPGFDFGGEDDHHDDDDDDEFLVPELQGVRRVDKVRVGFATVAKKVDVKRLKRDLWSELEAKFRLVANGSGGGQRANDDDDAVDKHITVEGDANMNGRCEPHEDIAVSFRDAIQELEMQKSQIDATLPFYFICILHLANEKGLRLESAGGRLDDFTIHPDASPSPQCSL